IPREALAFQLGEAAQVASGGLLEATPHLVRAASSAASVARNTFAVFLQPDVDCVVGDAGVTFGEFTAEVLKRHY
ncbi:hypothetical protein HK405_001719, partial [Cladochytrium tenue]